MDKFRKAILNIIKLSRTDSLGITWSVRSNIKNPSQEIFVIVEYFSSVNLLHKGEKVFFSK
jgi:hypothetical protein